MEMVTKPDTLFDVIFLLKVEF